MKLYENISNVLSKENINLATGSMYDYMRNWKEWYAGSVADFHFYTARLANGNTTECERLTMNMAKKLCEDMAKLLWTEKTEINLSNKKATQALWRVLDSNINAFTTNFPIFLEKALALGNGALIEYKSQGETIIDYVPGDLFIPYKYNNNYVYGLITISRQSQVNEKSKEEYLTHITYHDFENKTYKIKHEAYKSNDANTLGKKLEFAKVFPNIEETTEYNEIDFPYFQIFRLNIANNLEFGSPLAPSMFANSIDRLKSIDMKYDSFMNEFVLGQKRILVDNSTIKAKAVPDENGNINYVNYFDANDKVYVAVEGMEKQPAKEVDFKLRTSEHIEAINAELNWLSDNVGLGEGWYQFDGAGVKTATEVISENSKAFRTRKHLLTNVNDVVYDMVNAICKLENIKTKEISIVNDDSIIEDKNAEKTLALMEVQQGLMSKKKYLIKYEGLSEDEAIEELETIDSEKMSNQELFGFPTEENPGNTPEKAKKEQKEKDKKKEE